jgi:threonine aldolase
MIDLRSDTITKPTPGMREAMMAAEVGDDVFGEDPTINRLQERVADITGKDASLFVPSGTMGNQVCIKTHTQPGQEIIVERVSHIFNYECGSPGLLSGVQVLPIMGNRGAFTLEQVREVIRPPNVHHPKTSLICFENTHNRGGGTIFPFSEIKNIYQFARKNGISVHLDGARLWNAAAVGGISIAEYCRFCDSVSMCFSKGLGAPVGSIIAGSREFIEKARFYRKAFGGGMRQAGILAAAALYALDNHLERLKDDHRRAKKLAEFIAGIPDIVLDLESVQTNIIIFDLKNTGLDGLAFSSELEKRGVRMLTYDRTKVRAVTHLQVSDEEIDETIGVLENVFGNVHKKK